MNNQSSRVVDISLIMIAKNEEKLLPQCLQSVRDYIDEIIVVDTGSTDRTVEIAKNFGAEVYHHLWEASFSKHRNQSISYARGEWLLMLDADEELKKGSGEVLRKAVGDKDIDSIDVTNISFFNNGSSEAWINQRRVFRNKPDIFYEGIVHEQLVGTTRCKRYPIYIYHYGYDLEGGLSQKKHERNVELIKKQIVGEPDNYFYHLNLAVCYSTHFEFRKAIDEALKAIKLARDQAIMNSNVLWAKYIASSGYLKLDDLDNAEKHALEAVSISPYHLDSYFVLVLVYHRKKKWAKLLKVSSELLKLYDLLNSSAEQKFASRLINMANEEWRVHLAIGDLYLHCNDREKADKEFRIALQMTAKEPECQQILGDFLRNAGLWLDAKSHYEETLMLQKDNQEAMFGLALAYKNLSNSGKYRELIGKIEESEIDRADIFFEKGLIDLKDRGYESAIRCFNEAIKLKSDFYPAYLNLALAYKYTGKLRQSLEMNLKALELKPESTDAMINLGHLYYEMKEFGRAREMLGSALDLNPGLVDIRILLCEIHLMDGEIEKCVYECDHILKELNLPRDMTLNSLSDLAGVFFLIGAVADEIGGVMLSSKAMSLANQLDPQIEEKLKMPGNEG